jgi:hypothetical protein
MKRRQRMNDFEVKDLYEQVQKIQAELDLAIKNYSSKCCCDKKEEE